MKQIFIIVFSLSISLSPIAGITSEVGIKIGLLTDGELETSEPMPYYSRGTTGIYALGVFNDMVVSEKYKLGVHLDFFNFTDNYSDENITLIDLGVHFKSVIHLQRLTLQPALGLGYGLMEFADDTSSQLLIQGLLEFPFKTLIPNSTIIGEVGFVASPTGGVSGVTDITFPPMFFFRAGISF